MQDNTLVRTTQPRQWIYVIVWGVVWWMVIVIGAFLWSAPAVRHLSVSGTSLVQAGPFEIAHITKTSSVGGDGVTLAFTFQYGLALLGLACCALQAIVFIALPAFLWHRHTTTMVHIKGK
jgi:hypothetical protein